MRAADEARGGDDRDRARRALADEREGLRAQLFDLLDPLLTALGLVTAALLVAEFAAALTPRQAAWVDRAQPAIWAVFAAEFAVQFALAPAKPRYLRGHWPAARPRAPPAFRAFRLLRAARALRSLRLVRLLGGANRAMGALRAMLRGRQFGYLVALTLLVVAPATAGIHALERDRPGANIPRCCSRPWPPGANVSVSTALPLIPCNPPSLLVRLLVGSDGRYDWGRRRGGCVRSGTTGVADGCRGRRETGRLTIKRRPTRP